MFVEMTRSQILQVTNAHLLMRPFYSRMNHQVVGMHLQVFQLSVDEKNNRILYKINRVTDYEHSHLCMQSLKVTQAR